MTSTEAAPPEARPAEERSTHASTLGELFPAATTRHSGTALRHKHDVGLGGRAGDRVAILSDTLTDLHISRNGTAPDY